MSKQFCRKDSTIHGVGRLAKVLSDGLSLQGMVKPCAWGPQGCSCGPIRAIV